MSHFSVVTQYADVFSHKPFIVLICMWLPAEEEEEAGCMNIYFLCRKSLMDTRVTLAWGATLDIAWEATLDMAWGATLDTVWGATLDMEKVGAGVSSIR